MMLKNGTYKTKMNPCKCGSTEIAVHPDFVECRECGDWTGLKDYIQDAIDAWNTATASLIKSKE